MPVAQAHAQGLHAAEAQGSTQSRTLAQRDVSFDGETRPDNSNAAAPSQISKTEYHDKVVQADRNSIVMARWLLLFVVQRYL